MHKIKKDDLPNMTSRSELPNMREKMPAMNVHTPPSIEAPVRIENCLTSFVIWSDPGSEVRSKGIKTLRDNKISPEIGGSGSGNTLSILNVYES